MAADHYTKLVAADRSTNEASVEVAVNVVLPEVVAAEESFASRFVLKDVAVAGLVVGHID